MNNDTIKMRNADFYLWCIFLGFTGTMTIHLDFFLCNATMHQYRKLLKTIHIFAHDEEEIINSLIDFMKTYDFIDIKKARLQKFIDIAERQVI